MALGTGTGGLASAVPLVTKGWGEVDGTNVDMNYFMGIDTISNVLAADFEDMANGGNHPVYGTTAISSDVWHYAAATYDGKTWRLYLDGNLEIEQDENATPRDDSIQHAGLASAMTSAGTPSGYVAGVLDEVRIWDHARLQQEIQDNLGLEIPADSTLLARWGLNEGSGKVAGDSTGNGNDGTIIERLFWVGGAPFDDIPVPPAVVSFQDSVDGYTCTRDTYIYDLSPGTPRGSEITMVQDKNTTNDRTSLFYFDLSSIPAAANISSAELQFYVDPAGPGQGFNMHRMLLSWDEATVTYTSIGGHFAADDTDAESSVNTTWPGNAGYFGTITVSVPVATIQNWIDGTLPNYGWLMIATHASDGQELRTREHSTIAHRPRLTVSYIDTYTLTYTAGANGTLTGTTSQVVDHGADGTAVTAVPDTNYHFVDWSDGSTDNPRTDTNVTASVNVTATFAATIVTQDIILNAGWNMISSYVEPLDPDMEVLFAPIVNDMVLIKNGAGEVYWPGIVNNIVGGWNALERYQIYMTTAATLFITGTQLVSELTPLNLDAGWRMISYLRGSLMTSDVALNSIAGDFVLMKNNAGEVYWPDIIPGVTIDMLPG